MKVNRFFLGHIFIVNWNITTYNKLYKIMQEKFSEILRLLFTNSLRSWTCIKILNFQKTGYVNASS